MRSSEYEKFQRTERTFNYEQSRAYQRSMDKAPHKLTAANLCGSCINKDLFISINGAEKKHIYSTHPVKDLKVVRRWWIDENMVLQIRTWPWNAR